MANGKKVKKSNDLFYLLKLHYIETLGAILMIAGLILTFFYIQLGGALAGLGFGLVFGFELQAYLLRVKSYYLQKGLFKTFMLFGVALYLLIVATAFIISAAIGFIIITLLRPHGGKLL